MEIVIRSYVSGSFLLEQEPNIWDAIVILDSGAAHTDFVADHARRHLYLRFDDVDQDTTGKRSPSVEDVRSAIEFATESRRLLVCCRAGQSRSAATAFVICFRLRGESPAQALIDPSRHVPNPLIIELGSQVVEDPLLMATFDNWRSVNKGVRLSDNLDAIEREFDDLERQGARNRIIRQ